MNTSAPSDAIGPGAHDVLGKLVRVLQLEQIEVDLFRGPRTDEPWPRVYGGEVIGQALMAACRTVDAARPVHSLHAYFMRPGDPHAPILYQVERDRDGGSFTSRRVVAIQHGQRILNLAASFHVREPGLNHQFDMPEVPGPEGLRSEHQLWREWSEDLPESRRTLMLRERPLEFRPVVPRRPRDAGKTEARQAFWFRANAPVPEEQTLHRVMLAYASDATLLGASMLPHGLHWLVHPVQEASLDHALWIHDDIDIGHWMLYVQDSPWTGAARGIARGLIYTVAGKLVASVMQEGLIRSKPGSV